MARKPVQTRKAKKPSLADPVQFTRRRNNRDEDIILAVLGSLSVEITISPTWVPTGEKSPEGWDMVRPDAPWIITDYLGERVEVTHAPDVQATARAVARRCLNRIVASATDDTAPHSTNGLSTNGLTARELAERAGVHISTARKWLQRGLVPASKLPVTGSRWVIEPSEMVAAFEPQTASEAPNGT